MNKQLQEEIVYNFLSSCFGVDIKESFENISEDDIKGAIQYINLLTYALNEQVNMKDAVQQHTRRHSGRVAKGNEVIQDFLQNPGQYATPDTSPLVDGGLDKDGVPNLLKPGKPATSAKDYVTKRSASPNRQDEIEAIYSTYDGSGQKPYQGPGGEIRDGNVEDPKIDVPDHPLKTLGNKVLDYFKRAQDHRIRQQSQVQKQLSDIREPRAEFEKDLNIGWKPDPNARLRTPYELANATPEQRAASKRQNELEARHDELNRKDIKTLTGFDIMNPEDDEKYADEYLRTLSDRIRRQDFASGKGMDPYPKNYESQGRPMDPSDPNSLRQSDIELDSPAAVKSDEYYGLTKDQVKAIRDRELLRRQELIRQAFVKAREEQDAADKLAAEIRAGRGTAAGERRINDLLSKPAHSARAEAARQQALASRESVRQSDRESGNVTAISDPDRFEFYSSKSRDVTPTGKVGGGDAAFTLDDITKYHTKQRIKELTGGRSATMSGSNLYVEQYTGSSSGPTGRVNVINVGAERETGRRMANSGYPGSSVGPPRRPASQERLDAMDARIANADNYREFINTDPEFNASNAMWEIENDAELTARRERLTQNLDAASRARDEYAASERGQSEINNAVAAENASRERRKLPPLNPSAERRFRRSAAASGGRRDQYTAARDERMGLPPVETQQPQTTGQPQRAPWQDEGGNFVNPASNSEYSTSGQAQPGTGNTTSVASVLNSRGSVITPTTYRRPGSAGFGVTNTSLGNNIGFA